MTTKSRPAASAHFADRPVPAPPPMIGWPRATFARRRATSSDRDDIGLSRAFRAWRAGGRAQRPGKRGADVAGEGGVVDGGVVDVQRDAWVELCAKRADQSRIGRGIVERLDGRRDSREAP